jgi:hypothetical protein
MATSNNLVAGKAIDGQGGNSNNGQFGLKAKLAVGVVALGCAAILVIGEGRIGSAVSSDSATDTAVQQATGNSVFSPVGRTGPSDESLQADFASTRQIPQRTGPADEYMQGEFAPLPSAIVRTGPADEYTQAEGVVTSGATHGTGPADEYDR